MEIEHLKGLPDGSFASLPIERQEQLLAWYRVRVNPKKTKAPTPQVGRGRQPRKQPPRGR